MLSSCLPRGFMCTPWGVSELKKLSVVIGRYLHRHHCRQVGHCSRSIAGLTSVCGKRITKWFYMLYGLTRGLSAFLPLLFRQVPPAVRLNAGSSLVLRWNLCLAKLGLSRRDNRLLEALMVSEVRSAETALKFDCRGVVLAGRGSIVSLHRDRCSTALRHLRSWHLVRSCFCLHWKTHRQAHVTKCGYHTEVILSWCRGPGILS